jgi:aminomethyltransferase
MATGEIQPVGLAVRDILRMEMKYCLYGNDIDDSKNPIEAGLGWITDLKKDNFIGRDVISAVKKDKPEKRLIAFIMEARGIPRPGYEIQKENSNIGIVTSGTQSLGLQKGIGLAYVSREFSKSGTEIDVLIRNKPIPAKIIKPPFIKITSLLS